MERQRLDKWLWHARVVRTRSAAAALAGSGHVRVNSQRIDAASRSVHRGDVVTIALDRSVRVLKVLNFAERRGDADAGRQLYEDLVRELATASIPIATGEFRATMAVELVNDGPVTILIDSRRQF